MTRSSARREESSSHQEGPATCHVVVVVFVVATTVLASIAIAPTAVTAGDSATTLDFDPDEIDADPGETVTVDVTMSDHGDLYGNGVAEFTLTVAYDADVVTLTDVDHDPWLDDETANVDADVDVDDEAGTVTIAEERDPAGDGVTGSGTVATLTFTVAEDAEPTNAVLAFEDADVVLSSDWPQGTFDGEATMYVDGGIESDDGDDLDGVTLGEDAGGDDAGEEGDGDDADRTETTGATDDPDSVDDEMPPGTDDSIPGFDVIAALVAVAVGAVLVLIVVRRREL